jgi:molecular chaperone DnaK
MAADNRLLGEFNLDGIPPAPRGVPQIQVTFDLDANGILNVKAKDLGTGKEKVVPIEQSGGLSDEEIKAKRRDAELHADEDKKKRALVEARNEADSRCYSLEKLIKEQGDKLSDADKAPLEGAMKKVRDAASGTDVAAIKSAIQDLDSAAHAFSENLYKSTQAESTASAAGGAESSGGSGDDEAIDAEFEVKKD